jgi:hypothetical protein
MTTPLRNQFLTGFAISTLPPASVANRIGGRGIRRHRWRGNHSATATAILNGSRERHHHRI